MKPNREGGFLIAKIHQAAGRIFAAKLKAYNISDINPAQGRILFVLWEQDGISINELAKRASLGKSTLTSMLDRLEDAGFVRRVPSPDDRRAILIERTQKDKDLQAVYLAVSQEMNDLFYRGLSDEAIDTFEQTLRQILENVTGAEHPINEED
ncbi:transcriptional regulator, MarR family [Candidatus Moduliflexus flocculans]|uniref:Transcriptional regulator, MarR family n=1 Tax=Candidatus Moduliflexus flocculans TaxID=1499966 RepID=A0A081BPC7_9BACT|nr:transcriptional regulator, MarR family [Candidatus Moduliflexus flocculans]